MAVDTIFRVIFGLLSLLGLGHTIFSAIRERKSSKNTEQNISNLKRLMDMAETPIKRFSVSAYLDRIEKAWIEILEDQKPIDHTIVL